MRIFFFHSFALARAVVGARMLLGPDNIGPKLIKEVTEILIDPLVHIFNLSLTTGVVPDKLKVAKITPVFKKGDPQLPSNYRPISLLTVFSKLLEKIMHKRLYSYLNSNNKLCQYQFGFRKYYSTIFGLIDVADNIYI